MKLFKLALCSIFVMTFLFGCTTKVSSLKVDKDLKLTQDEGYLLISVETQRDLEKINISGQKSIELTSKDLARGSNYILTKLPAGHYQIDRVFLSKDIRFHLDRIDDVLWKFDVEANAISYVGNLEVRIRSSRNFGYFELVNQSSMALEYLEKEFPNILSSRKLKYSGPGDDRFFELVESELSKTGEAK